jgi:dipeptidyl aminopeptidase/acylaminoacyl peptidase
MDQASWALAKEILADALDLATPERADYVRMRCGDNAALAQEIFSMLSDPAATGAFLEAAQPGDVPGKRVDGDHVSPDPPGRGSTSRRDTTARREPTGRMLGHYRIVQKIGEGGMGVVYRGQDIRLGRPVAIKVLRQELATNPERVARLKREAHILASLNHSNIAAIYGFEEDGENSFLAMEFVEGATLADHIAHGRLRTREAIDVARQIGRAIEEAHDKGIVHRDLKPANVKITPDGTVKVLDFGLAKALEDEPDSNGSSFADVKTRDGLIMGTAAYMSPEQTRGLRVGRETDIWAYGCVLFEMLTGKKAFSGRTPADVEVAILAGEPAWELLSPDTPPSLRTLLHCCLEPEPKKRLRHIGDAHLLLEAATESSALSSERARAAHKRRGRQWLLAMSGLVAIGLLGAIAFPRFVARVDQPGPMHLPMAPPLPLRPNLRFGPSVAVSPDGRAVVYVLESGTTTMLYLKRLEDVEARPMQGTEGARTAFFSPGSGEWIGFYDEDGRKLKKVSVRGGEPIPIMEADFQRGAVWASDDTILFASSSGLVRVPASGGKPQSVTTAGASEHGFPTLLPGGRVVLFTRQPDRGNYDDEADIMAVRLPDGTPKVVLRSAYYPRYSMTGHLIFVQGDAVLAAPFDTESLEVTGPSVTVLKDLWISKVNGYANLAFSDTGTLVYISGGPHPSQATLVSVDRTGKDTTLIADRRAYRLPRVSPDGRQIALTLIDRQLDIWIYDLNRQTLNRVTDSPAWDGYPIWERGGRWITFSSMRDGLPSIYRQDLVNGTVEQLVKTNSPAYSAGSWSPDGKRLAYAEEDPQTGFDIWIYSLDTRSRQPFLRTPFNEANPEFSPDGRFIAYESSEEGRQTDVYVRPYPAINPRKKISTNGGTEPRWGPNGRELFYRIGGKLMAVDIQTTPELVAGVPSELFEGPYGGYDVLPNGRSFVMVREMAADDPPTRINLVVNWFEELKQLVSSTKRATALKD